MELLRLVISSASTVLLFMTILVLITLPFSAATKAFFKSSGYWVLLLGLNATNAISAVLDISTNQGETADWAVLIISLIMVGVIVLFLFRKKPSSVGSEEDSPTNASEG
jgi:hypothetical protein